MCIAEKEKKNPFNIPVSLSHCHDGHMALLIKRTWEQNA